MISLTARLQNQGSWPSTQEAFGSGCMSRRIAHLFSHLAHCPVTSGNRQVCWKSAGVIRRSSSMSRDEVFEARKAAANDQESKADAGEVTIFDRIARGDFGTKFIHEDDLCVAFHDANPQAPVHFLVIPKDRKGLSRLSKATEEHKPLLGHLLYVAQKVAKEQGLQDGFRVNVNDGMHGGQSVYHLHLHIMGGRQMGWPPG